MKNTYVKPMMQVEEFLANCYCSDCGKTVDGKYLFKCDKSSGAMYLETNGRTGRQTSGGWGYQADQKVSDYYSPCTAVHKADSMDDFVDGYIGSTPVIIWLELQSGYTNYGQYNGKYIKNAHATTNLDREHYQVVKS